MLLCARSRWVAQEVDWTATTRAMITPNANDMQQMAATSLKKTSSEEMAIRNGTPNAKNSAQRVRKKLFGRVFRVISSCSKASKSSGLIAPHTLEPLRSTLLGAAESVDDVAGAMTALPMTMGFGGASSLSSPMISHASWLVYVLFRCWLKSIDFKKAFVGRARTLGEGVGCTAKPCERRPMRPNARLLHPFRPVFPTHRRLPPNERTLTRRPMHRRVHSANGATDRSLTSTSQGPRCQRHLSCP